MPLKYRPDMTPEEEVAFMAQITLIDLCYADTDEPAQSQETDPDDYECFDPVRDGWVGKDGRP